MNLSLTDCLKNKLEEKGATVMLTRAEDCVVSLDKRAEMTEKLAPDIMISLHFNSVDASSDYNGSTGGLVLYSVPLSETLASCVASTLGKGIYQDTVSVRRQSLKVCRQTECPAILVEGGYLCNPQEYEMLLNRDIHEKMAQNIVEGLEQFFVFSSM